MQKEININILLITKFAIWIEKMYSNNNTNPSFYQVGWSYEIVEGVFGSTAYNHHVENINAKSMDESKAAAASNSHKEAERRRRKRINDHIATLKSILPHTIKTDKASLLEEAVRRVRELEKRVADLYETNTTLVFPSESDELSVSQCEENHNLGLVKATLCCEDRPNLVLDSIRALELAAAKVVRTEMSTVGGRTKTVMWVRLGVEGISDGDGGLERLRRALKTVVHKSVLFVGSGPGNEWARWRRL